MASISETSFASVDDLEKAWRELSPDEKSRAETLLLQSSNYLRQIAKNNQIDLDLKISEDETGVYDANVKTVVIASVQRLLASPIDMVPDATQFTQSATPYSESMSFAGGASANLYFKDKELKLLNIGTISGNPKIALLRGVR